MGRKQTSPLSPENKQSPARMTDIFFTQPQQ